MRLRLCLKMEVKKVNNADFQSLHSNLHGNLHSILLSNSIFNLMRCFHSCYTGWMFTDKFIVKFTENNLFNNTFMTDHAEFSKPTLTIIINRFN